MPNDYTPPKIDPGHDKLIGGIRALLSDAEEFHFHDFKNTSFATPKIELVKRLKALIENATSGEYDN